MVANSSGGGERPSAGVAPTIRENGAMPTIDAPTEEATRSELFREAMTMALYVAVCVLAVLTTFVDHGNTSHTGIIGIVWGTAVGLAVAHLFAFRLSARLVASGNRTRHEGLLEVAQLAGAAFVAVLVTLPLLLLPDSNDLSAARIVLAAFIALVGYSVARSGGASVVRAASYGAFILIVGMVIVTVKNTLSGH